MPMSVFTASARTRRMSRLLDGRSEPLAWSRLLLEFLEGQK